MPENLIPSLLTASQVAEALQIDLGTLSNWRSAGRGPAFTKLGGCVRYSAAEVAAFVKAGMRQNGAPDAK